MKDFFSTFFINFTFLETLKCVFKFFSVALVHFSHHYLHLHNS